MHQPAGPSAARLGTCALGVWLVLSQLGCADLRMQVVDTQERVVGHRVEIAPSDEAAIKHQRDGTRMNIVVTRGCQRVEVEQIEVSQHLEAREDTAAAWTLLGLAGLAVAGGVVLAVDGRYVYDSDRNGRQYNPVGPTGAYAGGGVLIGLGSLLAVYPLVWLTRVAQASEERTSTLERPRVADVGNVPCEGAPVPLSVVVSFRAGSTHIHRKTDGHGQLSVDVAELIPAAVAQQYDQVDVYVANRHVDGIPMTVVRAEQQRRDERAWARAQADRCVDKAAAQRGDCDGVRAYLKMVPAGSHADEARQLLTRAGGLTIATTAPSAPAPPEHGHADDGVRRAQQRAKAACASACGTACAGKGTPSAQRGCAQACIQGACR